MRVTKAALGSVAGVLIATSAFAQLGKDEVKRLNQSATVLSEIRGASDNGIPEQIWNNAECVVVIPSLKKPGFLVGGEFGSGVMSCRQANQWSSPIFMKLTKGNAGLQAGVQTTELVLVIMNKHGIEKLLANKVTLGGDASIAAGPVGRTASAATDAQLSAEMLSYSRSKGLFAGIDLSGGSLRPDDAPNTRAYGSTATARQIAMGLTPAAVPAEARGFTHALERDVRATSGVK